MNRKMNYLIAIFSVTLMTVFGLFAKNDTIKAAETKEKYVVATDITFAPFEYEENGQYVGIDMDLLRAIAEVERFEVEIKPLGFDAAVQALESDQVDGVIAGMSITDARKQTFDFSDPYYNSGLGMAVKADSTIASYEDLKGKNVAVKRGTEGATYAESIKDQYGFTITVFDDSANMYEDVLAGNSVANFEDYPVMAYAIKSQGLQLKMPTEMVEGSSYGFATRKGEDPELVAKFNSGLKKLKENGEYDRILEKYLGKADATAAQAAPQDRIVTPYTNSGKHYVIATDVTFAPFEFEENGEYRGIDMDLIRAIAEDQGFTVEIKPLGFDAALQALEAKQVDGVIAGMSITDARKQTFDFSNPYFESGMGMAVPSKLDIESYDDLNGLTVAVKRGTEGAAYAESLQPKHNFQISVFDDSANMYEDVLAGNSQALFEDYPVMAYAIKSQNLELKMPVDYVPGSSYGFAVAKGEDPELLEMFNAGLTNLQNSGTFDTIVNTYIGTDEQIKSDNSFFGLLKSNWRQLLSGLSSTILTTFFAILIGLIIGIFIGLASVSDSGALNWLARIYVGTFRGLPMIVLAFFVYFGIPSLTGVTLSSYVEGIISLSLNAGAYLAEIIRGGIQAVDKGQFEAAWSLGLNKNTTMAKIVMPQAIKIMVPSFINQFVITLKDTSILSVIGLVELTQTGRIIIARTYASGNMWLIIGLMYIIIITILTFISNQFERSLKND